MSSFRTRSTIRPTASMSDSKTNDLDGAYRAHDRRDWDEHLFGREQFDDDRGRHDQGRLSFDARPGGEPRERRPVPRPISRESARERRHATRHLLGDDRTSTVGKLDVPRVAVGARMGHYHK